jgi:site-specific DNA-methyltransferase (adenine-specific)
MTIQILRGDCLELMKSLPDKSIDLFICDLPYGQLASKQGGKLNPDKYGQGRVNFATEGCDWDVKIDLGKFWEQVERLCKNEHTPVLHFCNTKFGVDLINSKPNWFRYDIVWNKGAGVSFLLSNVQPMKSHEMIYVFSKKGAYYKRIDEIKPGAEEWVRKRDENENSLSSHYGANRNDHKDRNGGNGGKRCPLSVINFSKSKKRGGHPTEKSVEMYKWLIARYCPEGGTVCDPTAGSFNSIEAARDLGFNAIGMEKDDKFYNKAAAKFGINIPENIIEPPEISEVPSED